jgi:hypothetical protein
MTGANAFASDTRNDHAEAGTGTFSSSATSSETPALASTSPTPSSTGSAHAARVCADHAANDGWVESSSARVVVAGAFDATALQMAVWHTAVVQAFGPRAMFLGEPSDAMYVLCYLDGSWGGLPGKGRTYRIRIAVGPDGKGDLIGSGPIAGQPVIDPATVPMPVTACHDFAADECGAVVKAVEALAGTPLVYITLGAYVPPCMRAHLCGGPFGGYDETQLVRTLDASDVQHAWACDWVAGEDTTCRAATSDEETFFLPVLHFRLKGTEHQSVVLASDDGSSLGFVVQDGKTLTLTSGTYTLATPGEPCNACYHIDPPFIGAPPPDWCRAGLMLQPSDELTVRIHVRPNGPCSIKLLAHGTVIDDRANPLLTQPPPGVGATAAPCGGALLVGALAEDPAHGLGIRDASGTMHSVVWPFGYAEKDTQPPSLLDASGANAAFVGDALQLTGTNDDQGHWLVCPGTPLSAPLIPTGSPQRPVDPSVAAISRSEPGTEALAALSACHVPDQYPLEEVTRMGFIPHASDARQYVRLTGREPELATDAPAWLVEFAGPIPQPMSGENWFDAVCAVVDGNGGFFATGDVVSMDGRIDHPLPVPSEPTYSLPTLAP